MYISLLGAGMHAVTPVRPHVSLCPAFPLPFECVALTLHFSHHHRHTHTPHRDNRALDARDADFLQQQQPVVLTHKQPAISIKYE